MDGSVQAEIVSTGDEVLTGAVVDSNAAHISQKLIEAGVFVNRHTCVGDDEEKLADLLAEVGRRSDIAVITGGLGPTVDDITAEAAARAAGIELAENPVARSYIESFFKKHDRSMRDSDAGQAMLPVGAEPILNPIGTAPGFRQSIGGCTCFFLPGVPAEMRLMMKESVIPVIESYIPVENRRHYREKLISLFGLPEAEVNQRLKDASRGFGEVKLGMVARFPTIDVKLTAYGKDSEKIVAEIDAAAGQVEEILGHWIFSIDQKSMEAVVGQMLREKGATVALAESCTGGLIAHKLSNVSGSSDYFLLSAVTYANAAKTGILGVDAEIIGNHGAVSEETARAMAEGVRKITGADYGLSTSGIAGPTGGTDEKPVGTVCIGVARQEGSFAKRFVFPFKDRLANKEIFAQTALDLLRRELVSEGRDSGDSSG